MDKKEADFLNHAANDMEEVIAAGKFLQWLELNKIEGIHLHQLRKVTETGLVVSYCRSFTTSNYFKKLEEDSISHLSQEDKDTHKYFLFLRHKRYGHTDKESSRTAGKIEDVGFFETWDPISMSHIERIIEIAKLNQKNWRDQLS